MMRALSASLVSAALFAAITSGVSASAAAPADRSGLYLSLSGGYTMSTGEGKVSDVKIDGTDFPDAKFDVGDGASVHGAVGLYLSSFRLELEAGYGTNKLDDISVDSPDYSVTGDTSGAYSLMINGYYDIPLADRLNLYVGGGLGVVAYELDVTYNGPGVTGEIDGWGGNPAYQAMIGLTYDLTERVHLSTGYRFMSTFNASYDNGDDGVDWTLPQFHTIEAGLRFDI